MATIREPERHTRVLDLYDVVVAGAGTAGVIAAIAAVRNGARTMLIERGGFFGGHIATQLLEHSSGWFDASGVPIVGGLPDELVRRLKEKGASPGHVEDDTGYARSRLPVEHELFKSIVTEWLAEEGVTALPQTAAVDVFAQNGVSFIVTESKSGRLAIGAGAMVDTTGDADLCARADCAFHAMDKVQPVSMLFKLGNVDHCAVMDHVRAHPEGFKLVAGAPDFPERTHYNLWGFGDLLRRGLEDGVLSLDRKEMQLACSVDNREAVVNVTRVAADATDVLEMARAEVVLRRQVREFAHFFRDYVPGFQHSFLSATASCVGVRESRRILGRTTLTDADVRQGRSVADAVARGGFPIDSHDAAGNSFDGTEHLPKGYDIPLGALLPDRGPNIVVAGRCISAERRALASARITATCTAMGQAAGTVAALSARACVPMSALPVSTIQDTLLAQGAIFQGRSEKAAK